MALRGRSENQMKKDTVTAADTATQRAPSERSLKAGLGQSNGKDGKLVIVRPSALDKDGITGTVASGILEKVEPNKFNAEKSDYFIRNADGTLYILNETKSIKDQLGQDGTIGLNVRVEYLGKIKTKNGKGFHDFSCFVLNV